MEKGEHEKDFEYLEVKFAALFGTLIAELIKKGIFTQEEKKQMYDIASVVFSDTMNKRKLR